MIFFRMIAEVLTVHIDPAVGQTAVCRVEVLPAAVSQVNVSIYDSFLFIACWTGKRCTPLVGDHALPSEARAVAFTYRIAASDKKHGWTAHLPYIKHLPSLRKGPEADGFP